MAAARASRTLQASTSVKFWPGFSWALQQPGPSVLSAATSTSVRTVFLTAESAGHYESHSPAPPPRALKSDELADLRCTREVVRPLFKALLLAVRRLNTEIKRHKSREILSASEVAWLQENVPAALASLRQGPGNFLEEYVSREFRKALPWEDQGGFEQMKKELGSRLDTGFSALSLVNNRLGRLAAHAADPRSDCLTHGIRVRVQSHFSDLDHRLGAVFKYTIRVRNEGKHEPVQLISRHWIITDFDGKEQSVIGPGVVGKQPILELGEEYEYESFTPLHSKRGTQRGTFSMLGLNSQELFDVKIAPFALVPRN